MTALTMPAGPGGGRRQAAAGTVAADGRGHLAAASLRAGRRGRAARGASGVAVDRRYIDAPRLRRCHRLPPGGLARLPGPGQHLQRHGYLPGERRHPAGGARGDRSVRRGAVARQGAGDRYIPVRLDSGLRPVALGAGQAGAARGRGDRRYLRLRRAVVLVLPAVLRPGKPGPRHFRDVPVQYRPVRPARNRVPRLDARRLRDRRPGRDAHPPGRPRNRRHPGRLRRARLRDRAVPARALPDAAGHHQQLQPARLRVDHQPVVD